ncbi:MAG: mechanosensitive ion channel family protein [Methanomassiliicoccaceae archaeon]|nr:mechanosensitive ion channel family protein [Methanomassiliicoccaceae archaeon]
MRPAKVPALLLVVAAASMLLILPAAAPVSAVTGPDALPGEVGLVLYGHDDLEINAGSSESFWIEVVNYVVPSGPDTSHSRMISVSFDSAPGISVYVDEADRNFTLKGDTYQSIKVSVDVGRYAAAGTYNVGIILTVTSMYEDPEPVPTGPVWVKIVVLSPLSSGDAYNKILGVFDNPLPEPFDGPLASAVITFILWLIIGALAVVILVPLILRIFTHNYEEESKKLRKTVRTFAPPVLLLYAFDNSLRVYGASEEIVGVAESWFEIFYIVLGAMIAWMVYLIFIQHAISKMSKNKRIGQRDVDIEPLLRLLGKLVISVMAVALMLSVWGFNLTAIITGAGIVSLGITLGAQNILNQFFSGMVLLLTRPFKSGDLVKIGSSSMIYKVSAVNIMSTVFENWDNEETVIMPNNMVSSSAIVNLTGDGLIYKVTVFMNIAYENDIDLAKEITKVAAEEHPNVITNGSVSPPSVRVSAFLDSGIELRLACYVYDFNDSGKICGELREAIFKSFKKNGISVPFPQIDVHLDPVSREDLRKDD